MNLIGTQELRTERLTLRRFTPADAPAMFRNWAADALTTKYLSWEPYVCEKDVEKFLEETALEYRLSTCLHWAIVFNGEPIGSINLHNISEVNSRCELGYCLGSSFWNRGLMTEATERVIDHAFEDVGFERIYGMCDEQNLASDRVMQKCRMKYEGKLRSHYVRKDGSRGDVCLFGLLRGEWEALKSSGVIR